MLNSDFAALMGAFRLLQTLGRDGIQLFTADRFNFRRSFFLALVLLPLLLPGSLVDWQFSGQDKPAGALTSFFTATFVVFLLDWFGLPIVVWAALDGSRLSSRFYLFVICRNWCAIISALLISTIQLLRLSQAVPEPLMILLILAVFALTLAYRYWGIAASLSAGPEIHLLMLGLDLSLSWAWVLIVYAAFGV